MKKTIIVKTCDLCKLEVKMFCDEPIYGEHLKIIRNPNSENKEILDICLGCNQKIIDFIYSLDESNECMLLEFF